MLIKANGKTRKEVVKSDRKAGINLEGTRGMVT